MSDTVTATEANRGFSELLREVGEGKSFVITSHGRPVARLIPHKLALADRLAARQALFDRLDRQGPTRIEPWTRSDLYDD